ncbi:MAG TPA: 50S ribosomal protein L23, partial [Nitrososphaera sp.]|nr:50S ribosomal protein L23 [Nitrososphaera sp.]
MSKENNDVATKTTAAATPKKETAVGSTMTAEQATTMIIAPYVTEKTFTQIEKENKLAFIVADHAGKKQIIEAIRILYEAEATDVNTARTIRGKKAFVRFKA